MNETNIDLDNLQMDLLHPVTPDPKMGEDPNMGGTEPQVDSNGRCLKTGRFLPGKAKAGPGRPKGSRSSMTKRMIQRVAERSEAGLSMEEIMMDIAQAPDMPPELRFKAAKAVADLVYPKAASVEVKMDEAENMSIQQIDDKLKSLLALANNS